MTYSQMISLLPDKKSPVSEVGRGFFAPETTNDDRKQLIETLLQNKRFEQLFGIIYCSHLKGNVNLQNESAGYAVPGGEMTNINTRYFSLFLQIAYDCYVSQDDFLPFIYAAATANNGSVLRAWQVSARRYLTKLTRADYDKMWEYFNEYDSEFKLITVLCDADYERTMRGLTELAIFGRGINKVALRNVLRGYAKDVFAIVEPVYAGLKNADKVAATRLLLSLKNDDRVMDYLNYLLQTEKSKSVRSLLEQNIVHTHGTAAAADNSKAVKFFYNAMVHGVRVSEREFLNDWLAPPYLAVAESLFFSVYKNGLMQCVVIVDQGRVLDLDNQPYTIAHGSEVTVTHPVELGANYEYLRRLDISQPFEQIKRKVYLSSGDDRRSNGCFALCGTVINAQNFKLGLKQLGFKPLNRNSDGLTCQVGLLRDGILCVLNISPIDLAAAGDENVIQAQSIRFYAEQDVIRLGGKQFVDGVTPYAITAIPPRSFSEFMYSVYSLMGCR